MASNDGYLLRHFRDLGIPHLGIEPAANVAAVARAEGIDTEVAFFGRETALTIRARYRPADLIAANNVMAHVPDLNDFVAGFKALLADEGVITVEFPHLLRLMEDTQRTQALMRLINMANAMIYYQEKLGEPLTERQKEILRTIVGQLEDYLEATLHGGGSVEEA